MNSEQLQLVNHTYKAIRQQQALQQGRELTLFDNRVSKVIADAAYRAMADVGSEVTTFGFNLVPAPTGSGKTTNSIAFALSCLKVIPGFTAAFVVTTVRECEERYRELTSLLGPDLRDSIVVWSTAHDVERSEQSIRASNDGFVGSHRYRSEDLKSAPVVIVTHKKWQTEQEKNVDSGVLRCKGRRRHLVFIDECPDMVVQVERRPSSVSSLKEWVIQADSQHPSVIALEAIERRMALMLRTEGLTYESAGLEQHAGGLCLSETELRSLQAKQSRATSLQDWEFHKGTLMFLHACAEGCAFFYRRTKQFTAYVPRYVDAPGLVVLDATADLSGLADFMPGTRLIETPAVDYCNLTARLLSPPDSFQNIHRGQTKASDARLYVAWMREQVLEATAPGDKVLIVTHRKYIIEHELLRREPSGQDPWDWEGREVYSLYWGTGIGSNNYKHIQHVFTFGEFFKPGNVTVGNTLGLQREPAAAADFTQVQGRTMTGPYLGVRDGDLLRWCKQLVCRGNARNIDGEGRCGMMTWHTSMDRGRFLGSLDRLFPGLVAVQVVPSEAHGPEGKLAVLLSSPIAPVNLSFKEVACQIEVEQHRVGRTLSHPSVAPLRERFGWEVVSAKQLGKPGKEKFLSRSFVLSLVA